MTNYIARGRQVVVPLTNKSAGSVAAGDTVILSSGTAAAFTTTTSAGQVNDFVGVVYDATIAQDAIGLVIVQGFVPLITLSGSASLGDYVKTHSVAKQSAPSATRGSGSFGQVLGTGTTPAAFIWGFPDPATAGNVATDAIWDAAGDLVQGTGADAASRLAIGTANQLLRVNSGATAVEWASVGRVLISEQTPTGTGTVTWSSIAATYASLAIEMIVRTDKTAVASNSMYLYFNNDTTAGNYRRESFNQTSTTLTGGAADNSDGLTAAAVNALADNAIYSTIQIPFYAKTVFHKCAMIRAASRTGASTSSQNFQSIFWESTLAINRIDIVTDDASNYITGTTFRLYGVY